MKNSDIDSDGPGSVNHLLTAAFNETAEAMYVKDRLGRYLMINPVAAEMLGVLASEALGKTDVELFPEETAKRLKTGDERVLDTGREVVSEETIEVNGRPRVFQSTKVPYKSKSGRVRGIIGVARDITERKRIEGIMSNLATRFASIYGTDFFNQVCGHVQDVLSVEFVFVGRIVPNGHAVRVVGGVGEGGEPLEVFEYDLAGTPCAEVIGRQACVYPRDVQELFPEDPLLVEMDIVAYAGIPLYLRSDEPIGILVALSRRPLDDERLALSMMTGYSERVSAEIERWEAETALKQSEEKFSKVFQHSPDAIAITDLTDLRLVEVNEGFSRITGFSADEALGKTSEELGIWEDPEAKSAFFARVRTEGEVADVEVSMRDRSGQSRICFFSGSLIDLGGRPHIVTVAHDITERRGNEEALRSRDRDIRKAYSDVFSAVTDEKLLILTAEEIGTALGERVGAIFSLPGFVDLAASRAFLRETLGEICSSREVVDEMILAAGEATANGVKHGNGCELSVYRLGEIVQIMIADRGPGIDFGDLPKATLLSGFSTKTSLGVGFSVILEVADRVLLSTGAEGTTIVLEHGGRKKGDGIEEILARGLLKADL